MVGLPMRAPAPTDIDRFLHEDETVSAGAVEIGVLHTPGHTPGSLSFFVDGQHPLVLAGDTLFFRGIGRTDLWGGDHGAILASIHTKLFSLPEPTVVVPGHGPATTIGEERRLNPFLR
jgi:glyoxylase-like metal-dependent hydrolase (beta-lactamase superfamily II)